MHKQYPSRHDDGITRDSGFTLVEIMVVIVILGILATIVGTNVLGQGEKARVEAAKIEVKEIYDTVKLYMIQNAGRLPEWEDLITPDAKGHKYIEIEEPKQDPWGNVYVIGRDPDYENKPMVASWGPDGQEGTDDDINNKNITRAREKN